MTDELRVWGQFLGQSYDLNVGDTQSWIMWGAAAENGVVAWISVKPFPDGYDYPGEKVLEVSKLQHEATDDGARRIFFSVTNAGPSDVLAYAIYVGWTDVIT